MRPCTCDIPFIKTSDSIQGCRLCWLYHNDLRYKKLWDMPTVTQQVKNFAVATKKRIENNFQDVDIATYEARLKTCETCDRRTDDWRCTGCGCFLSLKAKWSSETCPEGKWELPVLKETNKECDCGK